MAKSKSRGRNSAQRKLIEPSLRVYPPPVGQTLSIGAKAVYVLPPVSSLLISASFLDEVCEDCPGADN